MALTTYLDDSGTDAGNPCLVVGGFASSVEQWDRFENELKELDLDFEAPPFHAKEFERARHGYGPYAKWPEAKRQNYLNRLLGLTARRCFKSFITVLEKATYEKIIVPQRTLREYFYSPFVFSAINCVHAVEQWRDETYPGESILFVFDKDNKNQGQLEDVAKRIKGDDRAIEDITPGDDVKLAPLRVADLLAFEWCAEARATANPQGNRKYSRYPLLRLDEIPHDWVKVGEDNLMTKITELLRDGTLRFDP